MNRQQEKAPEKKKQTSLAKSFVRYTNQVANTVLRGVKMAGSGLLDPLVSPMTLVGVLKEAGIQSLAWKPETLCAYLDKTYGGWSSGRVANALEHFHETGEIQTSVPALVRHKLYAIRIIQTSDTAHREWHIFEKVGSAFSNRLADFTVVEPLSPLECAVTVATIEKIRPDQFSEEIASYIAASCHLDGVYTLLPCKWLKFAEAKLQSLNAVATKRPYSEAIGNEIADRLVAVQKKDYVLNESFADIQALKLLALNVAGDGV